MPGEEANYYQLKVFDEAAPLLSKGMGLVAGGSGVFEWVTYLMDFETFALAIYENPELVSMITKRVGEYHLSFVKKMATYPGVRAVWIGDDMAYTESTMVSPQWLRKNTLPWIEAMSYECRKKKIPILLHADGCLWGILDDIVSIGINALHPIEPKAMDIREVKKKYGKKLCLIGNIDLGHTLTRGTPEEVREEVKTRIKDFASGGGYCLGSSNSITQYVPFENYKAMIESAIEYGKYPIAYTKRL